MTRHRHRRCAEPLAARIPRKRGDLKIKKGLAYRSIIATRVVVERPLSVAPNREYSLHATKGYRAMRA